MPGTEQAHDYVVSGWMGFPATQSLNFRVILTFSLALQIQPQVCELSCLISDPHFWIIIIVSSAVFVTHYCLVTFIEAFVITITFHI